MKRTYCCYGCAEPTNRCAGATKARLQTVTQSCLHSLLPDEPAGDEKGVLPMAHDSEFYLRRAAEVRSAASRNRAGEDAEAAGQLAFAYAALARRRAAPATRDPAAVSASDPTPLMLND